MAREMLEVEEARQVYTLSPKLFHQDRSPNSNKLTHCRLDVFPPAPNLPSSLLFLVGNNITHGRKPQFGWCESPGRLCLLSVQHPGVLATKVSS
jgi:hypothetical protein